MGSLSCLNIISKNYYVDPIAILLHFFYLLNFECALVVSY